MAPHDPGTGTSVVGAPRRTASRSRRLLGLGLVAVLAWSGVSFLATSGATAPGVSVLPGASAGGAVADVHGLSDVVTSSTGHAFLQTGVKFARIDVAEAYRNKIRVTLAWQNPSEFARSTGTGGWQMRLGLYYPVRTGTCTSTETSGVNQAVNVHLSTTESYDLGTAQDFCAYRDVSATGHGAVTSTGSDDRGTQLLASDWLLASLRPGLVAASAPACTATGTAACAPAGLGANRRTYFVLGSLLNPGGKAPPGQTGELLGVKLFVRATKIGA